MCRAMINVINASSPDLYTVERYLVTVMRESSIRSLRIIPNTDHHKPQKLFALSNQFKNVLHGLDNFLMLFSSNVSPELLATFKTDY